MKHFITLFAISILLISCNNSKSEPSKFVYKKNITKTCGIKIPDHMKIAKNLNDEASLQYQNIFKELYVVIIDEDKKFADSLLAEYSYDNNIKGYIDFNLESLNESINNIKIKKMKSTIVGEINHNLYQIEGQIEDLDICYLFNYAESKGKYYQVMAWTLKESKDKNFEAMETMTLSLKEF